MSVTDGRGGAVRDGGLARWLEGVAPASARGETSVALVSDARMRSLNRSYRRKDYATDVLSFPSEQLLTEARSADPRTYGPTDLRTYGPTDPRTHGPILGDIVIATGVARRQAREAGHSYQTELRVLALHGLLHLLGYDHEDPDDNGRMKRMEERLRRKGGLAHGLIRRSAVRTQRASTSTEKL